MLQTTLCFIFNPQGQILLCLKKRSFGEGKWNGAGGKQLDGDSIEQTAMREFQEETGVEIVPEGLAKQGILHFYWPHKPDWNQSVHVFVGTKYEGEPTETEEMRPQWWDIDKIPYEDMRDDDKIWLPRFLRGEKFEYEFTFNEKSEIVGQKTLL